MDSFNERSAADLVRSHRDAALAISTQSCNSLNDALGLPRTTSTSSIVLIGRGPFISASRHLTVAGTNFIRHGTLRYYEKSKVNVLHLIGNLFSRQGFPTRVLIRELQETLWEFRNSVGAESECLIGPRSPASLVPIAKRPPTQRLVDVVERIALSDSLGFGFSISEGR